MTTTTATMDEIADDYVRRKAELDPVWATVIGMPGHDDRFGDYSPEGVAAGRALAEETLAAVGAAPVESAGDRVAGELMTERLRSSLDLDAAEWYRSLNSLGSPLQSVRRAFDLMPVESADDWAAFSTRLGAVPAALESYRRTLMVGVERGETVARRQVEACQRQAAAFAGSIHGVPPFTRAFLDRHAELGEPTPRAELERHAEEAASAFESFRRFLADTYLPSAREDDAVGRERYQRFASYFTGAALDLDEAEAWGWEEVRRLDREMERTAHSIAPASSVAEVVDLLEQDPGRSIEGGQAMIRWLQDLLDRTIDELDGRHFAIPAPIRRLEVVEAPPGGPPVAYYTGPSEDFSRPGRYWFPAADRTRFPLWQEVSIAYHEGVPGHHLEIATQQYQRDRLNRFSTTAFIAGYSEGWALYAERLMDELGYYEKPDYRLGMLAAQSFRALRVVIDMGLHLGRSIPDHAPSFPGEPWTPERAHHVIAALRFLPEPMVAGEITRYLGLPGQAISYKVGERVWRRARALVEQREGDRFSLPDFHARALSLGVLGLDQLERELTRPPQKDSTVTST